MANDSLAIQRMFESVSLGAPENAVGFVLWRVVQRYQREMDRSLAPLDLTNLQFVTLALVAWFGRSGEPVHQATVAKFGGIHPMQVSHMLKTLEGKGFILRKRGKQDTRTKELTVTPPGLQVLRQAMPLAIVVQEKLFGTDGKPSGKLLSTLRKLDKKLDGMFED